MRALTPELLNCLVLNPGCTTHYLCNVGNPSHLTALGLTVPLCQGGAKL